jgi:hypothetical protein
MSYAGPFGSLTTRLVLRKKHIKHPGEIIYVACSFVCYWAGLYSEESPKMINLGVELMVKTALCLLGRQGGANMALKNEDDKEDEQPGGGQHDGAQE